MQDIETKAIQNYQENMIYFQDKHPQLHNKILALDSILSDGTYPQKYELEYKDDYFDIVELQSNQKLYQQNSIIYSEELSKKVNLKKNIQSFKTQRKLIFDKDTLDLYKIQNAISPFISVAHIMEYHNTHCDDSMSMDKINKYIFFGTGLAFHIDNIVSNFSIPISLVIEDDIELFRLSMFTTNYKNIFEKRKVFFSIAENKNEFHETFHNFFLSAFFKNHFIKYSLFSDLYQEKIDDIRSFLISRPEATYSNEKMLEKNNKVLKKIKDNYKFLNLEKKDSEQYFKDKPWLIIAAGPSLQSNLEWLKENHNKYIIITLFVTLKILKKANIVPDIAVHIDEGPLESNNIFKDIGNLDFLKDTLLIYSASISQIHFDKFDKKNIFLHEDRTKYKLGKSTLPVTSVGETIYSIALIFNASSIYLLGLDFALGDDDQTHSDEHITSAKVITQENDDFQLRSNILYVKGNQKNRVKSIPIFTLSIPVVNSKTREYKSSEQNVYNLSQNGAYFEDTIPLNISDIKEKNILDKTIIQNEIRKIFNFYSTSELNNLEMDEIKFKIEQISDLKILLEKFKTSPVSNGDIFLISYENLVTAVFKHSYQYELWEILTIYFLRISSFVDDLVCTVELKNKKKHVKKLKQFLVTQIEKIILTYEENLKVLEATEVA
ncbi:MAG: DUF115 domain-containing protein [Sulfurimonas sp.]|uniref:motility associated factor glycosyltransferase family protein n=1 Tax=Sulfurimonas sp. TaxID=2022749 RepID=UPI0025D85F79|nr:6-hydroxymethylpterin diphosphokinase MptE-like protein [Sulfurimonas sp.]MCK9492373.1 DUF115 domain-containing protein [Sulfurimonas sp.]